MTTETHILVILVALASLAFVARLLRRRRLSAKYAILWLLLGMAGLTVAVFPGLVDTPSRWLGIPSGVTTAFLGAITVLVLLCMDYSWELTRLEDRSRILAQEVALLRQRCTELEAALDNRVRGRDSPPAD